MNDGGPAFPQIRGDGYIPDPPGMSLRDWFAGMTIQGILFAASSHGINLKHERVAENAYCQADAMLKAREHNP